MRVSVPATSANLGPGFDTLGLAINLRNEIEIKPSKFLSVSIHGEGGEFLKRKTDNIFVKIFYEKYAKLTGEKRAFRFVFNNKIPISRGLGSSSAAIVGAIAAAYKMANIPCGKDKILNEALFYENHPDNITPTVFGGFCVAIVKNKKVRKIKAPISQKVKALIVVPNVFISTKKSRDALEKTLSLQNAVFNISRSSLLTAAFITQNYSLLRDASQDLLHQTKRMSAVPVLFDIQKTALENGALMSTLSGSGSSMFSLFYKDGAQKAKEILQEKFREFFVGVFDFDNDGLIVK